MRAHPRRPGRGHSRRLSRLAALTALGLVAAVALSSCGDDEPSQQQGEKPAAKMPLLSPLTGLQLDKRPQHPILAVKIDNSSNSAPQVGLGAADMVVEELVEGGITRLAAFYYSQVPARVGPVRSMRATDIGIVDPLNATLVASGGAPVTVKRVKGAGIRMFTEGAKGYYRDTGRSAPYNLFMRLPELARSLDERQPEIESYLPFGTGLPKGRPAKGLTAMFSGGSSTSFSYRNGGYVNTDSNAAQGDVFVPKTVLVLRVKVGDAGYTDPAGNPVPETKFTGTGHAMVFHGGRLVQGTWTKDGFDAPVRLEARGQELQLPPGPVWIELVPVDGGGVTVGG